MAARASQKKAPRVVTAMRAHQLLEHPSYQAIEHLHDSTTGLKVGTNGEGDQWTDDCILSAWHLSSQNTCELHLSRDSSSLAYSSWLCI
jgi:hypothetical protein